MATTASHIGCYLAEWYRPALTQQAVDVASAQLHRSTAAVRGESASVRLLALLAAPDDHVLYGLFTADSRGVVTEACRDAGFEVDRLTERVDAHFLAPS